MHGVPEPEDYPSVSLVIATQDRMDLLQKAIRAAWNQDYPGFLSINVVYDNYPMHPELARAEGNREIRVMTNSRTKGLAGARNSGIIGSTSDYVAFCDDDDLWKPSKLTRQVELMRTENAQGCVSGIEISYGEKTVVRIPRVNTVNTESITRDRLTGAHPSSYIFKRSFLTEAVGLVDEDIPYGYGEDYDLLIRSAALGKISVLAEPAVEVLWHKGGSKFSRRWEAMEAGIRFLINKHPELTESKQTASWLHGQRAFALASQKERRREGLQVAAHSIFLNPRQPRGYLALAVASGAVSSQWVVDRLNEKGRGI